MKRYVIQSLEGMNSNVAESETPVPSVVKNIAFTKAGGYVAHLGWVANGEVSLPAYFDFEADASHIDRTGLVGHLDDPGTVRMFLADLRNNASFEDSVSYSFIDGITGGFTALDEFSLIEGVGFGLFLPNIALSDDRNTTVISDPMTLNLSTSGTEVASNVRWFGEGDGVAGTPVLTARGTVGVHSQSLAYDTVEGYSIGVELDPSVATGNTIDQTYTPDNTFSVEGYNVDFWGDAYADLGGGTYFSQYYVGSTAGGATITKRHDTMEALYDAGWQGSSGWLHRAGNNQPNTWHQGRWFCQPVAPGGGNTEETPQNWDMGASGGLGLSNNPDQGAESVKRLGHMAICYSSTFRGYVWEPGAFFVNPGDAPPTGFLSSPAGLLIYTPTETYLLRGNIDDVESEVVLISSVTGHDRRHNSFPQSLGGRAYSISQGRVHSLRLSSGDVDYNQGLIDISEPVFDEEAPFLYITVDVPHQAVYACRQETDGTYTWLRFDVEYQRWSIDTEGDASLTQTFITPSRGNVGPRRFEGGTQYEVRDYDATGSQAFPDMFWRYEELDLGDPALVKLWNRVIVHTNIDSSIESLSVRYFVPGDDVGVEIEAKEVNDGVWAMRFEQDTVATSMALEFTVTYPSNPVGTQFLDEIRPPIIIEYAERYRVD